MADDNRLARTLEDREASKRPQAWTPPQTLPTPTPVDGWAFRWIRTAVMGQADPTNASAKFREGWVACKASDHPEMKYFADPNSRFKDNIEVGGLLLCKAPKEMTEQRDAFYRKQAQSQLEAVDNSFMRQNDARMPLFAERKSATSFGKGTK